MADLPYELLYAIFTHESILRRIDFLHLAQVCRSWHVVAIQCLWRTISFRQAWSQASIALFLETLSHTDLGQHCQTLQLGIDALSDDGDISEKDTVMLIFQKMPNLLSMSLSNNVLRLAPKIKREGCLRNVSSLAIDYVLDARPSRLRTFAAILPSLKKLSIHVFPSRKQPNLKLNAIEALSTKLDYLEIRQDEGCSSCPFAHLLQLFPFRSKTSLYAVWMARTGAINLSLNGVPLSLVAGLTLVCTAKDELLPRRLPQLTSCTYLCLHSYPPLLSWNLLDRLAHFQLLPSEVEVLELHPGGLGMPFPQSLLNLKQILPQVKKLILSTKYKLNIPDATQQALSDSQVEVEWWDSYTGRSTARAIQGQI